VYRPSQHPNHLSVGKNDLPKPLGRYEEVEIVEPVCIEAVSSSGIKFKIAEPDQEGFASMVYMPTWNYHEEKKPDFEMR